MMIKYICAIPVLLSIIGSVSAYIDDSMMRKYSTPSILSDTWSPSGSSVAAPKIHEEPTRRATRIATPNTDEPAATTSRRSAWGTKTSPAAPLKVSTSSAPRKVTPTKTTSSTAPKVVRTPLLPLDFNDVVQAELDAMMAPPPPPPKMDIPRPAPLNLDEIIRAEYDAWAFRHSKTKDDARYQIFRSNFIEQMEWNRKTGNFYLLNEFGDMTQEEYDALTDAYGSNISSAKDTISNDLDAVNSVLDQVFEHDGDDVSHQIPLDVREGASNGELGTMEWEDFAFAMDFEDDDDTPIDAKDDGSTLSFALEEDSEEATSVETPTKSIFSLADIFSSSATQLGSFVSKKKKNLFD
jgi:hypothetical protein